MKTSAARATKTASAFRMACGIETTIRASPDRIWALLTDAPGFPRWNSTGLMLPMIRRSLPDFAPVFEAYAQDLKRAAEGPAG